MGIGGSKPHGTAVATTLTGERRPLFSLRRKRLIIKTLSTISTRELLVTDTGSLTDCASSPSHSFVGHLDRSASSPAVLAPAKAAQTCSQENIREETSTLLKEEEMEESAMGGNGNEDDEDQMMRMKDTIRELCGDTKTMPSPDDNVNVHENEMKEIAEKEEEKMEEEEEEEGSGWVLGNGDMPSSPSFREYCRFSFPDHDNTSDDGKESFADAESSVTLASTCSAESGATSPPVKTPRRSVKERFGRLRILIRGPIAISNLLSMWSCYNYTSRTSGETKLLSVKSGS